MTQHWNDIGDSDCIMVIGGNPAENHPVSMRHVQRAIDGPQKAKLICVDPRYTRTAAKAHYYAPMRSGTDIAFIDGMINYAIQHNKYNQKYVLHYTNAGFLLRDDFQRPGDLDGRFSGFSSGDPGSYNTSSWGYAARPSYNDGTVSVSGDVLTGVGTQWLGNIKPDDKITLPTHTDPGPFYVKSVDNDTQITLKSAASAPGGPGLGYEHQSWLGIDLAQDFFDSSGNCICGACSWTNTSLTLNGLAAFRSHLAAAGKLPSNAGLSVWESAKLHYARYDVGTVSAITGCPVTTLNQVYSEYTKTGTVGKAGTIMYAMGTTQHTVGTQNIRAYASLQLLLGNTGLRGGGINACRGESNVQGSTDHCLLFHILPGYLKMPSGTSASDAVFDDTNPDIGLAGHPDQPPSYIKRTTPWANHSGELNWWVNTKKYVVSLLKCYWGAQAVGPDFCYNWLPKIAGNHSHISIFEDMDKGDIKGLLCFGQNPAVGGPNSKLARRALRKLDWLVVSDLWETETAAFWRHNLQGKLNPAGASSINTEVFLLPAACHIEKDGSVVNSSRWTQFRYQADSVNPPGHAKHEIEMLNEIYDHVRALCDPMLEQDKPLYHLCMGSWHYDNPYGLGAMGYGTNPPADFIDMEINGFNTTTGDLIGSFGSLQADGSTASGNWLYCGSYTGGNLISGGGTNKATNRDNTPGIAATYSNWAWSWPVNRRIIYNGASLIPCGFGGTSDQSWDSAHPVLVWDEVSPGVWKWTGDVPDGVSNPHGETGHVERGPFIMKNDGHGHVHGFTCAEGPYPEHYEPLENPFAVPGADGVGPNPMGHNQLFNPCAKVWQPTQIGDVAVFPIVGTTYRVSEHWQAGAQTRNLPWLKELVPNVFCEMSKQLATILHVSNGDKVKVVTKRGKVVCFAVVTDRFQPFAINGTIVHQIGVIWHFGYKGLAKGHSGNILTPHVGDANTMIPEYKAFRCKVVKLP